MSTGISTTQMHIDPWPGLLLLTERNTRTGTRPARSAVSCVLAGCRTPRDSDGAGSGLQTRLTAAAPRPGYPAPLRGFRGGPRGAVRSLCE